VNESRGQVSTIPTGITVKNSMGRLVEATTTNCVWPITQAAIVTDEWFSYDGDGNQTDIWQLTPHSTQYYHSTATFFGNGAVSGASLASPNLYSLAYGLDPEGRWNTVTSGQTNVVTGVTYNVGSQPTKVSLYSTDNDAYTYDPNTGRMTNWDFTVSSKSETGFLNWNPNGTLKQLTITDGFNAGGAQTCTYNSSLVAGTGYDDLGRLIGSSCGTSGSIWNQAYSYDPFGNLTKSSTGFVSWNPGYSSSTNHYTCAGCTYDASGNVTNDGTNAYAWDGYNKMISVNASGTNCSTGGQCFVYDAFGRAVEIDSGSTYTEIWYTQLGKTAYMNGTTINYAYWPTPGGGTLLEVGNSSSDYYLHKDWLGNSRLATTVVAHTLITDRAYAPFGEVYNIFSSTSQNETMFTGLTQDVLQGMYDTPNRELQGSQQGRWLSPDPAGLAAVDPTNPQTWNRYAYVGNTPLNAIDPLGLDPCYSASCEANGQTDNGGYGYGNDPTGFANGTITVDGVPVDAATAAAALASGGGVICQGCGPGTFIAANNVVYQWIPGISYTTTQAGDGTLIVNANRTWQAEEVGTIDYAGAASSWGPLYPPSIFTPGRNMPIVSQWRPPKPTDIITGLPAPYKPSVVDCMTGPNDAVDRMTENAPPIEHDPSAGGVVWQPGNRGAYPVTSPETTEGANALTVLFASFLNWVGCMANAF